MQRIKHSLTRLRRQNRSEVHRVAGKATKKHWEKKEQRRRKSQIISQVARWWLLLLNLRVFKGYSLESLGWSLKSKRVVNISISFMTLIAEKTWKNMILTQFINSV